MELPVQLLTAGLAELADHAVVQWWLSAAVQAKHCLTICTRCIANQIITEQSNSTSFSRLTAEKCATGVGLWLLALL